MIDAANTPPRVYLAGPEVFLPNAVEIGHAKCEICHAAGLEGVYPLDNQLELAALPPQEQARRIALANEALIRSSDIMIANLTPFRGVSADAGTVFEVGFMRALGRPVFAYTHSDRDYAGRVQEFRKNVRDRDAAGDPAGLDVEDFGLADNLMIAVAVSESGGALMPAGDIQPGDFTSLGTFRQLVARVTASLGFSASR